MTPSTADQATVVHRRGRHRQDEPHRARRSTLRRSTRLRRRRVRDPGLDAVPGPRPSDRHRPGGDADHVAADDRVDRRAGRPRSSTTSNGPMPPRCPVLERLIGRIAMVLASRIDDAEAVARVERGPTAGVSATVTSDRCRPSTPPRRAAMPTRAVDRRPPDASRERASGNPFLIEQLAAGGESESLRLAVAARLHGLDAGQRRASRPARPGRRARSSGEIERRLPVTRWHGWPRDRRRRRGWSIRHALLADAVLANLDDAARARLHARLASIVDRARRTCAAPACRRRSVRRARRGDSRRGSGSRPPESVPPISGSPPQTCRRSAARRAARRCRRRSSVSPATSPAATALLDQVATRSGGARARADAIRARVCWSIGRPGDACAPRSTADCARGRARYASPRRCSAPRRWWSRRSSTGASRTVSGTRRRPGARRARRCRPGPAAPAAGDDPGGARP